MFFDVNVSDKEIIEKLSIDNLSEKEKYYLLKNSILTNRNKVLKYLLEKELFVYSIEDENSVYECCVLRQNYEAFGLLNSISPLKKYTKDLSLLYATMYNLSLPFVKMICENIGNINAVDPNDDFTCVDWAIQHRNPIMLELLLQSGANIPEPGEFYHCLSNVASENQIESLKLLIEYGCDLNCSNNNLISNALYYNLYDMAELLIENGADVNKRDGYGLTPLHDAIVRDDYAAVFFLKSNGADENIPSSDGITPKMIIDDMKLREAFFKKWYSGES